MVSSLSLSNKTSLQTFPLTAVTTRQATLANETSPGEAGLFVGVQSLSESIRFNQTELGGDREDITIASIGWVGWGILGILLISAIGAVGAGFSSIWRGEEESDEVPGSEFAVDLELTSESAVRTQDYLRADMGVTVYVYIDNKDKDIAKTRLAQGGNITPENITSAVRKRADAAIRIAASQKNLEEIHSERTNFATEVATSMKGLENLGLTLNGVFISEVEESDGYAADDVFDAQGRKNRTKKIQAALLEERKEELKNQQEKEKAEKNTQVESLKIAKEIEQAQIKQQLDIEKQRILAEIDQQLDIEKHRAAQEKEIHTYQKTILGEQLDMEEYRAKKKREIEEAKAVESQKLQVKQSELQKELEIQQLKEASEITKEEINRLTEEEKRTKAEEAVATAIEQAKSHRLKIAADSEAQKIQTLAEAEKGRQQALGNGGRIAQLVTVLAPQLMEKLPEIAQACAPQPGILGDAHIYAFPGGGNGSQDMNKLMLSTSGLFLLSALLEGRVGGWLEKLGQQLVSQNGQGTQESLLTGTDLAKKGDELPSEAESETQAGEEAVAETSTSKEGVRGEKIFPSLQSEKT